EGRLCCGPITLDTKRLLVFYEGDSLTLSAMEYQLLLLLMENKNRTVTRQRLLESIWDKSGHFVNDNTLTVTMKRLREKLHHPACLKTIRSFGYRMEDS
ncbi:MAG: winged helix-turn-helix domain-containing protein, partial [Eubacterium sp.]